LLRRLTGPGSAHRADSPRSLPRRADPRSSCAPCRSAIRPFRGTRSSRCDSAQDTNGTHLPHLP